MKNASSMENHLWKEHFYIYFMERKSQKHGVSLVIYI